MEDVLVPLVVIPVIFLGLPWLFLHYMTQWRKARSLSVEDERLLDEMHETARRLEERLVTIERIMDADSPRWREERFAMAAPRTDNPVTNRRH